MPITQDEGHAAEVVPMRDLVSVKRRYLRSVSLERDFYSKDPLEGYVITSCALATLGRFVTGVHYPHGRAITITGPYGSGKSAFALFAAKSLATPANGSLEVRSRVASQEPALARELYPDDSAGLWPILIGGSRQPIGRSLVAGLIASLNKLSSAAAKAVGRELSRRYSDVINSASPSATDVSSIFAAASAEARKRDKSCSGIFVVIDEAGKFLEYAAIHPDNTDVHVLQELAELAARSEPNAIFLVNILHQSFDDYGNRLSHAQRDEWRKVHGRFLDIPFGDGADETIQLIAQAIAQQPTDAICEAIKHASASAISSCRQAGLLPLSASAAEFQDVIRRTYPLHPITLLLLPHVFKRFGQSERSLFSFLSSNEPSGFQQFLDANLASSDELPLLRVDKLYDYVVSSLHSVLYSHSTAKTWSEAEESLFRLRDRDALQSRVLKAIGLLQALGEQTRIPPTRDVLRFAFRGDGISEADVDEAIAALQTQTLIVYRQFRQAFRLYEGSDIDIDARIREAHANYAYATDGVLVAQDLGVAPPIVARRHSFETGTFRYFDIRYCRPTTLFSELQKEYRQSDGLLLLCLASSADEVLAVEAMSSSELADRTDVIIGVSVESDALREAAVAVQCLRWVYDNTPELSNDRIAMREVKERLYDASGTFGSEWERLLHPRQSSSTSRWYYRGERRHLSSYRQLQAMVSQACEQTYPLTPRLLNEMVNRRQLTSTSAAARRNLIQAMLESRDSPRLGIQGFPAEASMYLSVLGDTGIHRSESGVWGFYPPEGADNAALLAVWRAIESFLFDGSIAPKPLSQLNTLVKSKPFGLADGVIPLLICAVLLYHEALVALYEEDRLVVDLDSATFERMIKRPEDYSLQGCRISGEREVVLARFAGGMLRAGEEPTLVNVTRQLYRVINKLPDFTARTKRLQPHAYAVRELFKAGRRPENLLFVDLPIALGLREFVAFEADDDNEDKFFEFWNRATAELTSAYAALLSRIDNALCESFEISDWTELRSRCDAIRSRITEPKLLAFSARAADTTLEYAKWLESVSAVVIGRPPAMWNDADEDRFRNMLVPIVSAFKHTELLLFEKGNANSADHVGVRISITTDTGLEQAAVAFNGADANGRIDELADKLFGGFRDLLQSEPYDVRVAVLSKLAQSVIQGKTNE